MNIGQTVLGGSEAPTNRRRERYCLYNVKKEALFESKPSDVAYIRDAATEKEGRVAFIFFATVGEAQTTALDFGLRLPGERRLFQKSSSKPINRERLTWSEQELPGAFIFQRVLDGCYHDTDERNCQLISFCIKTSSLKIDALGIQPFYPPIAQVAAFKRGPEADLKLAKGGFYVEKNSADRSNALCDKARNCART